MITIFKLFNYRFAVFCWEYKQRKLHYFLYSTPVQRTLRVQVIYSKLIVLNYEAEVATLQRSVPMDQTISLLAKGKLSTLNIAFWGHDL